ncbi:MAG: TonB-dependent receptor, partial [Muribaculaceae bacterium]|nr:TonB-dependent receptor [Muribaculaceae bacterium]
SKFAKGNRWGYFPAGSVAWRISEEKFMEPAQEWLSNLKLRASYGSSGNNRIGSALFETLYKNYSSSKYYGAGNIQNPHWTLNNSQLANPDLKWETTITRNIGLDFGFFNERLSGSLEFYWNSVKDLLLNRSITAIGYTTMQQNIGKTSNKGVELQLNAIAVSTRDFQLSINANIAYNQNRVDKLADADYFTTNSGAFSTDMRGADDYRVIVGQPLGLVWGFVYDGVYGVDDFQTYVDDAGHTQFLMDGNKYILKDGVVDNSFATTGSAGGLRPGAPKYKDLNGDGTIDADNDRQIIGRTQPKFTGGFGLNATWKGIDFSAMFNFVTGNDVYNMDKIVTTQQYRNEWSNLRDFMGASTAWTYLDRSTG